MAFPEIITDQPVGTQYVSTIDDFERETRGWLKQCIQTLSGYPDVNTVAVKPWTTEQRPSVNQNIDGNYLLGYNTTLRQLELVNSSGTIIETLSDATKKEIALLAHPVGEYYWTSSASFDPNTEWGGTWERIQDGRVLISNNSSHSVGSTGGSETVTLTQAQMPAHNHKHRHDRGTMNITGYTGAAWDDTVGNPSGAFYFGGNGHESDTGNWGHFKIYFDASRSWTGYTSYDQTSAGSGQSHNNMQPYRTAICWHRTA